MMILKRIPIWVWLILLVGTCLVLRHYWADFRQGFDYPVYGNGRCTDD